MTALAADRNTPYKEGVELALPVGAAKTIYGGSLVCLDGTTRLAEAGSDAASKVFAGVARQSVDNSLGAASAKSVLLRRRGEFLFGIAAAVQANVGDAVFVADDQTVALAAGSSNLIYCGIIAELESATQVWVDITPALLQSDVATHIADSSAAHAAAAISIADSAAHTSATTVEAALAELYASIDTAKHTLPISLGSIVNEDGTALTKFSSADAATCGFAQLANKEVVLEWNNHATPPKVAFSVPMPQDLDGAAAVEVHWLAKMSGATDTPVLEYEAYFAAGDTDCAGADDEVDGAATLTEYSSAIAHGDVPDPPTVLTVVFGPKAGELGTDDLLLYAVWLEYEKAKLS